MRSARKEVWLWHFRCGDSHLGQMLIPLIWSRCPKCYQRRVRDRRERTLKRQTRRRDRCIRALLSRRLKRRLIREWLSLHLLYLCPILYMRRLLRSRGGHILWHQRMGAY